MIVEYIVGVYYPCWFNIKVKHGWIEGPRHILYQLQQVRYQQETVVQIVMPVIQRSAWYAFSEAIIQTLVCSDDDKERQQGVEKIIALSMLRGEGNENTQLGDSSVRVR